MLYLIMGLLMIVTVAAVRKCKKESIEAREKYDELVRELRGATGCYDSVDIVLAKVGDMRANLLGYQDYDALQSYKKIREANDDKLIAAFKKTVPIGSQFTYLGLKAIVVGYYKDINGVTPDVAIEVLREDGEGKQVIETKYLDAEILYKMFPIN
jgi:hypothetical protein